MTACAAQQLQFEKYEGLGNDFILVDNRHQEDPVISSDQAKRLCDRNFGIGGDGVIFALPPPAGNGAAADLAMRIYNSDGSEPEMCGNGIRCLARFVAARDGRDGAAAYVVHTLAGLIRPALLEDGQVCVDMGEPILDGPTVPTALAPTREGSRIVAAPIDLGGQQMAVTAVSMGNPHAVVFVEDLDALPFTAVGPQLESHPAFPARCNAEFVQVLSSSHARMKVWERGAGPTLACGTGACAVLVAGVLEGRLGRSCRVDLPGGPLQIEWRESDNHVYMTGPAMHVFAGTAQVPS